MQEGANFELDITQIGYNNVVKQWTSTEGIDGDDNVVIIKQQMIEVTQVTKTS